MYKVIEFELIIDCALTQLKLNFNEKMRIYNNLGIIKQSPQM